jgi:hypothetical protein
MFRPFACSEIQRYAMVKAFLGTEQYGGGKAAIQPSNFNYTPPGIGLPTNQEIGS